MRAFAQIHLWAALVAAAVGLPAASTAAPPPLLVPAPRTSVSRQALGLVERLYVEPSLADGREMLAGALRALEARYPEAVADIDDGDTALLRIEAATQRIDLGQARTLAGTTELLERLAAFTRPLLGEADGEGPEYVALRGALQALDPHTALLSPEKFRSFLGTTRGEFGGIGIAFSLSPEGIVVDDLLPDSSAAEAGIAVGDVITAVDGVPAGGLTTAAAMELVRGEVGTKVALGVRPADGGAARAVTAVRALVKEKSVRSRVIGGGDGGPPLLYIAVSRFQQYTTRQLNAALADLGPDVAGVVLDLRGNPGGMLDPALEVADLFLDRGVILTTRDRGNKPRVFSASPFGIVRRQPPLAVLINRASASAAEVVAAALRDSRAIVVGETSYGKGSVQQSYPLDDGGALVLTIRHYYTPGDVSIQARGVEPDVLLSAVVVGEKTIIAAPAQSSQGHGREATLSNAFAARGTEGAGGAAWRISYLRSAVPVLAPGAARAGAAEPRPDEDAALRAAAAILRRAAGRGDGSRGALLAVAGDVAAAIAAEEEARIVAALALKGVDWSAGAGPAAADAEPSIAAELPKEFSLIPGETARLAIRLRNGGARTARRVWGRVASSSPFLANLDFVYGAIAPGETKEAVVEVAVPARGWARWDPFDLVVREGNGPAVGTFRGSARMTEGAERPLSYSLSLADEGPPGKLQGNGVLDAGERLSLRVRLVARGDGTAEPVDLRVSATPAGAVSIADASASLGGPGATEASFIAQLLQDAGATPLRFNLSFSSGALGTVIGDRIDVPVGKPYAAFGERRPPLVSAAGAPPQATESARVRVPLTVTDETSVKDVQVFVGDRKVFYRRASAGTTSLSLEVDVPLAEGSNRIEVVARDADGLSGGRTFFVYRTVKG